MCGIAKFPWFIWFHMCFWLRLLLDCFWSMSIPREAYMVCNQVWRQLEREGRSRFHCLIPTWTSNDISHFCDNHCFSVFDLCFLGMLPLKTIGGFPKKHCLWCSCAKLWMMIRWPCFTTDPRWHLPNMFCNRSAGKFTHLVIPSPVHIFNTTLETKVFSRDVPHHWGSLGGSSHELRSWQWRTKERRWWDNRL